MKKILQIVVAFLITSFAGWCLGYYGDTVYPGVFGSGDIVTWIFPIIFISGCISRSRNPEIPKSTIGFKIATYLLLIFLLALFIRDLIRTHGYGYIGLIFTFVILVVFVLISLELKHGPKPEKDSVVNWVLAHIAIYSFLAVTFFLYLLILNPLTINQASAKIQEQFPEIDYQCVGSQGDYVNYPPLGAYAFADKDAYIDTNWVFINKLTGEIHVGF